MTRFQVLDKDKQLEALEALEQLVRLLQQCPHKQMARALDRPCRRPMRPLLPRRRWAIFHYLVATCRVACRCQQRARSPQVLVAH